MSFVWTIAEQHEGALKTVSFELLARGRRLADSLETRLASLVFAPRMEDSVAQELIERGADEVYLIEHDALGDFVCETWSAILASLVQQYSPSIILAAATSTGRTLMPHLAVKVDAGLTADCTELDIDPGTDNLLQIRPAIGGNIMATIMTPWHRPQMATVRPRSSTALHRDLERVGRIIRVGVDAVTIDPRVTVLGYRDDHGDFVNLEEADVVVAGGKGLRRGDNFALLRSLAKALGAEVGATRDAVDRGWIAYPHQVGLSGKTISPRLYIGAGISGSIQHLAGIKTAETIVSINSDPDAPLHRVADFAIAGDLFEVIPELTRTLQNRKAEKQ